MWNLSVFLTAQLTLLHTSSLLSYDSFSITLQKTTTKKKQRRNAKMWLLPWPQILTTNSAHTEMRVLHVHVLCFIHRLRSNLPCALLAVWISLLEIMLKQYCLSVRVINHQLDKSSGHCWRIMSALLTFNAFGLLLVRWIIGPAVVKVENKFCVISAAGIHVWFSFYFTLLSKYLT